MATMDPTTWTPLDFPELLRQHIGFLFWKLQRGVDIDVAMEELRLKRDYTTMDKAQEAKLRDIAIAEQYASGQLELCGRMSPRRTVQACVRKAFGTVGQIGVRVLVELQMKNGTTRNVSVLVNVDTSLSIGAVLNTVCGWINANAALFWDSAQGMVQCIGATVSEVSGAGYSNASFSI